MARRIGRLEIDENEHVTLMDRMVLNDGSYLTQAATASATIQVRGRRGVEHEQDITVSDVIYDTLQTDTYWQEDRTGYNIRYTMDTEDIMVGGREYHVVLYLETVDFGPKYSQWMIKVRDVPTIDTF